MKAYPLDLRCRVVNAYVGTEATIAEVAEQFSVGTAFVKKMLRWHRHGASLAPRHGGGTAPALGQAEQQWLRAAIAARPSATLEELKDLLAAERAVQVSRPTLCRALQKLKLGRKKKASLPANATK